MKFEIRVRPNQNIVLLDPENDYDKLILKAFSQSESEIYITSIEGFTAIE